MKLHLEHVWDKLVHFCQKALIGQASAFDKWAYLSRIA